MKDMMSDEKGKERNRKRKHVAEEVENESREIGKSMSSNRSDINAKRVILRMVIRVSLSMAKYLLLKDSKEKNMVFSPLSLHLVLSMIAAGSDGSTLDELLLFLGSKSTDQLNSFASQLVSTMLSDASSAGGPHLCFANGVWVEQSLPVHHSFKQIMNADYKATLASVDFCTKADQVANEVNSWVKTKTKGLIKDLLPRESLNSLTRLILANALYFKGAWEEKFDASMTKDGNFHLLNGTTVKVPFMVSNEKQFISDFYGYKVLGLPYKQDYRQGEDKRQFSMYFFLPDAKDGLSTLVENVTLEPAFLESKLPNKKVEVYDFRIPKFKISVGFEASDILKELGVTSSFLDDANLAKMIDSPSADQNLYVSKIFHKSFIEINEEGTKAAATASDQWERGSNCRPTPRPVTFVADHPFLFVIREDLTGTILFIGQVLNPFAGHMGEHI
ncbi:serpin-ZX-like [Lotus japonicus]|uniref:serpin-ZX-like n=1 Tax=Lotus japonicus TaxID=34305 RepID=UPI00258AA945|nr:serpin-ZX-like [Lotus japonicus]